MHDWTGVVLKYQNSEGVVFTYEVDEYGSQARPIYAESIDHYRHPGFGLDPTYVCECGDEYAAWSDIEQHLEYFEVVDDFAVADAT